MGQGLNRFLEFIGLVDDNTADARTNERPRYREETYEEPRYTPRPQSRPASDARSNRFGGSQARSSGAQRARTDSRSRANAAYSDAGDGYEGGNYGMVRSQRGGKMKPNPTTIVYYLHSLSECSGVIEDLIGGNSVLLNLEETDMQLMQRVVDTLAGAAFALHAKIRKGSEKMYLIAPENVEVNMTSSVSRHY